jgi:hypothetical protein
MRELLASLEILCPKELVTLKFRFWMHPQFFPPIMWETEREFHTYVKLTNEWMDGFLTFFPYITDGKTKGSELSDSIISPRYNLLLICVNAIWTLPHFPRICKPCFWCDFVLHSDDETWMYFKFSGFLYWVCDSIVSVMNRLSAGLPRSCGLILVTSRLAVGSTKHPIRWEWGVRWSFSNSKAAGV